VTRPEDSETPKGATILSFPIVSGPVQVDSDLATSIATALADPKVYGWDYSKACFFDPGVALRFTQGESVTEVLLCFSCDELLVVREGKALGKEDNDGARGPLVAAAKRLFPDDKEIQALLSPEQERQAAARHQEKEQAIRRRQTRDMAPAVAAAIDKGAKEFARALGAAHPNKDAQIRALLTFMGGRNINWTTAYGNESLVYDHLRSYSREELGPIVREALLGTDRQRRRGAARLWYSWRSPLEGWKPEDFSQLLSARLTVMQEWRSYEVREDALALMEWYEEYIEPAEFDRRLTAGLHDPEVSVQHQAMLVAGRTGH
jgi:hypothetical protein